MGGYVAIGWRKNGKISCHEVHTGAIHLLNHPSFYRDDPTFWANHVERVILERQDIPLAPSDYGLVFADFDSRSVFSRQNYSSPSRIHLLGAEMDRNGGVLYVDERSREAGKLACLQEALRSGWSPGAHGRDIVADSFRLFPREELGVSIDDPKSLDALLDRVSLGLRGEAWLCSLSAVLEPPGWTFLEIADQTPRPYETLLLAMDEAGIPFTREEALAWNAFCSEHHDEDSDLPPEAPGNILLARMEASRIAASIPEAKPRRKPSI